MSNINLLPDDLKKNEERELQKLSKRSRKNEIEWNNPQPQGKVNLYSDVPQESFWSKIFGTRSTVVPVKHQSSVNMQVKPQMISKELPARSSLNVLAPLAGQKNAPPHFQVKAQVKNYPNNYQKKSSFWSGLFAPKEKGLSHWASYKQEKPSVYPDSSKNSSTGVPRANHDYNYSSDGIPKPPASSVIPNNNSKGQVLVKNVATAKVRLSQKSAGDSWFNVLKSLFSPHRQKNSWKMAGGDSSREKLIKESLSLSRDKTWENYHKLHTTSASKESHKELHKEDQKDYLVENHNVSDIFKPSPIQTVTDSRNQADKENKDKTKKAKEDKSKQGKYHLASKRIASGININLIPEELISVRKSSIASIVISLLAVIILAGLAVGGAYYFIDFNQKKIDGEIAVEKVKLDQLNSELSASRQAQTENYGVVKRILSMNNILKNHIYWTKFFALLEKYTLDSTYYSSFSANTSGQFSLPITARDYSSALAQIAAFNSGSDFAKSVSVDSMHVLSDSKKGAYGVGFDLKINLADGVFKK